MNKTGDMSTNKKSTNINNNKNSSEAQPSKGAVKKTNVKKVPEIKYTKTSYLRFANANPWLLNKEDKNLEQSNFSIPNIKLPKSIVESRSNTKNDTTNSIINTRRPALMRTASVRVNSQKTNKETVSNLYRSNSVRRQTTKQPSSAAENKAQTTQTLSKAENRTVKPKRRSLSAEHYDRKKSLCKIRTETTTLKKETSQSLNDVTKRSILMQLTVSPIPERNGGQSRMVTFKTPTPMIDNRRTSTPFQRHYSTPFATALEDNKAQHLWRRLENWMHQHKKPKEGFHHLKCFGLTLDDLKQKLEENKENVEKNITRTSSYDDLNIAAECDNAAAAIPEIAIDKVEQNGTIDMHSLAQDALNDLHTLILEGFSPEQCEAWLCMIQEKCHNLKEQAPYWECRAALEQARGNITSAVDCYKTAIIHGAQVNKVDQSLENLLEAFNILNINSSPMPFTSEKSRNRTKIVHDARNVFKSSIIQFALLERNMKRNKMQNDTVGKRFVATPVRRSTRSFSVNHSSSHVKVCSSLRDLDEGLRLQVDFKNNKALNFD